MSHPGKIQQITSVKAYYLARLYSTDSGGKVLPDYQPTGQQCHLCSHLAHTARCKQTIERTDPLWNSGYGLGSQEWHKSKMLASVSLFTDQYGLVRVGG